MAIMTLTGNVTLDVAGYPTTIEVTPSQLDCLYKPVLTELMDGADQGGRVLAGLAGIPGSGKSTFGAVLAYVADHVLGPGVLVVVGMDGWHWPNAVLDERTTRDEAGCVISLARRKGSPESFDAAGLAIALRELATGEHAVSLPVYDRRRHDPAPDALTIERPTRIVLIEGNYLHSDQPPWDAVSALLSPKLLLECDPDIARERIISRHIRGGLTPEQASAKYESNDRINTAAVLATADRADVQIQFESETVHRAQRRERQNRSQRGKYQ